MLILLFKVWDFKVFKIDFMFIKGSYLCCCVFRICNNCFFYGLNLFFLFLLSFLEVFMIILLKFF